MGTWLSGNGGQLNHPALLQRSGFGRPVIDGNQLDSLHATQYPWEHEKWAKTFDHMA